MSRARKKRSWFERVVLGVVVLLMLASGVIWGVSYFRRVSLVFPLKAASSLIVQAEDGELRLIYDPKKSVTPHITIEPTYRGASRMYWWIRAAQMNGLESICPVPLWAVFVALSVWPTLVVYSWYRQRHPPGHCRACGYDLRGSKGSATCPECGEAITEKVTVEAEG